MYFGSVKFFKNLIYTVIWTIFAAAVILAVLFGILYGVERGKTKQADAAVQSEGEIFIPDGTPAEEIYGYLKSKGYSDEEILACIDTKDAPTETTSAETTAETEKNVTDKASAEESETETASAETNAEIIVAAPEYTKLYPDLYATPPTEVTEAANTVYLTFDDGPSINTPDILSILDKYDIKATFFMMGGDDEYTQSLMKKVADKGHTIGVHSISHDYEKIYADEAAFLDDMNNTYMSIYNATGVKPQIMRFAGGSINDYNRDIYPQLIDEITRRGFTYFDWNVSGDDAVPGATWTSIYNNVLNGVANISTGRAIVLLHDSADKYTTVTTVEDIITALLNKGYTFAPLDNTVKPIDFHAD